MQWQGRDHTVSRCLNWIPEFQEWWWGGVGWGGGPPAAADDDEVMLNVLRCQLTY